MRQTAAKASGSERCDALKRPSQESAVIPTASMADIAFLLIIFFMVTTVHEVDRTSVNLPLAKIREEAEKGSAIVVLAKDKYGEAGLQVLRRRRT